MPITDKHVSWSLSTTGDRLFGLNLDARLPKIFNGVAEYIMPAGDETRTLASYGVDAQCVSARTTIGASV